MAIERDYEVTFAQPGDTVVIHAGPDRDEHELVVGNACDQDSAGTWYCATCQEGSPNNIGIQRHAQAGHTIVWMCWTHGPETVRT